MVTYGKKKLPMLLLLSASRGSATMHVPGQFSARELTEALFTGSAENEALLSLQHVDSIEQMASDLLADTTMDDVSATSISNESDDATPGHSGVVEGLCTNALESDKDAGTDNMQFVANVEATLTLHAASTPRSNRSAAEQVALLLAESTRLQPAKSRNKLSSPLGSRHVPGRKRRLKDNRFLVKVRTALGERLHGRRSGATPGPEDKEPVIQEAYSANIVLEDGSVSPVNYYVRKMREGNNLNLRKTHALTGSGAFKRKPVHDGGKSLWMARLTEDPFSSSAFRAFDQRLLNESINLEDAYTDEDMSLDQDHEIGLSNEVGTSIAYHTYIRHANDTSSEENNGMRLPSATSVPFSETSESALSVDKAFEVTEFSSSPVGQSTPSRRREQGLNACGSVRVPAKKLEQPGIRTKENPSPNEDELLELERHLEKLPGFRLKGHVKHTATLRQSEMQGLSRGQDPPLPLTDKDTNDKLCDGGLSQRRQKYQEMWAAFDPAGPKREYPGDRMRRPSLTEADFKMRTGEQGRIRRRQMAEKLLGRRVDVDELQSDETQYDIGMKRL